MFSVESAYGCILMFRPLRQVIWAASTPCPNVTTSMGRTDAKVIAYNAQARTALGAFPGPHYIPGLPHVCDPDYPELRALISYQDYRMRVILIILSRGP